MTEKRLLSDLTPVELGELFDRKEWLRNECRARREDSNYYQLEEIADRLREARHIEFSIGGGYGDHIKVYSGYYKEYFEVLQTMQRDFYIVGDSLNALLDRLTEKAGFFDDCSNGYADISDNNYNRLKTWFSANLQKINEYILEYCFDIANNFEDLEDELELFVTNSGQDFTTDGTYIYEVSVRKYA